METRYITVSIPQASSRRPNNAYGYRRPANRRRPTARSKVVLFGGPYVLDPVGRVMLILAAIAVIVLLVLMFAPRPQGVDTTPTVITLGNPVTRTRRPGSFASHRTDTRPTPKSDTLTPEPLATSANTANAPASAEAPAVETPIVAPDPAAVEVEDPDHPKVYVVRPPMAYTDEDLLDFARLLDFECDASWLPNGWQLKFGSVTLNRVDSREYPNTLHGVIYQSGQYADAGTDDWYKRQPCQRSWENARYLLESGERFCPLKVVFQANFPQGSETWQTLHDDILGNSYLCVSEHPEYYE